MKVVFGLLLDLSTNFHKSHLKEIFVGSSTVETILILYNIKLIVCEDDWRILS